MWPIDVQQLHDMISKHYAYTGSAVANFILSDFDNQLQHFVKVFPTDYKKALEEKRRKLLAELNTEVKD